MQINKESVKIILPIVAFLVIVQSVVLMSTRSKKAMTPVIGDGQMQNTVPAIPQDVTFTLMGEKNMKVGKKYTVSLDMKSIKPLSLSSLETYVKFPETGVKVENLKVNEQMGRPTFSTISMKQYQVVLNMLFSKSFALATGQDVMVKSFDITPTVAGKFSLSLDEGKGKTLIVQSEGAGVVGFSASNLDITVSP